MLQLFGLLHRGYQFRHRTSDWLQRLHFSVPETSIIRTLTISLKTVGKLSDVSCQDIHGASLYAPLALKHTYDVYFGYDRTLRKYGRFRQKLPVKTDIRKNSARRRPVAGRSPRTGEEAQYICSYSEQVRPEAFIIGSVCCFSGMIYPHIQRPDPVNRPMNDQQRIH